MGSTITGGGLGFLVKDILCPETISIQSFASFEIFGINIRSGSSKLSIFNVYRPPDSARSKPFSTFLDEFSSLLSSVATLPHNFILTGDFNIHVNDSHNTHASQFMDLLTSSNLQQHVTVPTHHSNNILDLVITSSQSCLSPVISVSAASPSDHFMVLTSLVFQPPPPRPAVFHSYRHIKSIDINNFSQDIANSTLINEPPSTLPELIDCYNKTLSVLLDKHAPIRSKLISTHQPNPWYTPALRVLKAARRRCEHEWHANPSVVTLKCLRQATNFYNKSILAAKRLYHSELIQSVSSQPRELWHAVNSILHRNQPPSLPSSVPSASIAQMFGSFFSDKIIKLQSKFTPSAHSSPHQQDPPAPPPALKSFRPATVSEICRLISHLPNKQCELDPIPVCVLKKCLPVLGPTITTIVNLSMSTGCFPSSLKQCIVTPLLKKPSLDKENPSNYRPISNLSFLSKLVERVVKSRLDQHLASNSLYNPCQSAYTRYHSTETALLAVHDSLIRAIAHQQVTCLCLLDLSAAFDIIDHNILIRRLSTWFGITENALSWFQSYLSNRHFIVQALGNRSTKFSLSCGVPQGSVLGPLLFILYTTPLSSLLSNTGVSHHLYADDTQLFISFSPSSFPTSIIQLQSVIAQVSSWMSANLLALNPSKTEFLVIGNPQQLSKINNPQLTFDCNTVIVPAHHARNLGVIFDNHLSMDNQISALSQSCFYHIRDLRRIRDTLDFKTASSVATALVHSKLD